MSLEIIDNFLDVSDFYKLKNTILGNEFPWYFNTQKVINEKDSLDNYQFTHLFYNNFNFNSGYSDLIYPLIKKINPLSIIRIKANLTTKTDKIINYLEHVDIQDTCKTAVLYINTNNGKTIFIDGNFVNSIENRICIFDSSTSHYGTSCTDQKVRCVININYIERSIL